jgi:amino acid transporter
MHQREVLAAGGGTISDTMHLVMGGVSNLFMMVAMGFAGAAFGKRFRFYTIVTILSLLTFGILTGMSAPDVNANRPTPLAGIYEIIMLGVFLLWVVVLAIILLKKEQVSASGNIKNISVS